jgi:hypothetical protein
MKKLLGIVLLGCLLCGSAYATIYEIESKLINSMYSNYIIKKICVDNKVFVFKIHSQGDNDTTGFVQMLEERDGKLLPAKC